MYICYKFQEEISLSGLFYNFEHFIQQYSKINIRELIFLHETYLYKLIKPNFMKKMKVNGIQYPLA